MNQAPRALTPDQERDLYESDRVAWLAYVAPGTATKIASEPDSSIGHAWATLPRDYQRAVWPHLHTTTRERIRRARAAGDVPAPTHLPIPNCPQPDQGNAGEVTA